MKGVDTLWRGVCLVKSALQTVGLELVHTQEVRRSTHQKGVGGSSYLLPKRGSQQFIQSDSSDQTFGLPNKLEFNVSCLVINQF